MAGEICLEASECGRGRNGLDELTQGGVRGNEEKHKKWNAAGSQIFRRGISATIRNWEGTAKR